MVKMMYFNQEIREADHEKAWSIIDGLFTKCVVKMTGYWPSSFFKCLWTEMELRSINMQKRTRPISSDLDQTSLVKLIKDLSFGKEH